MQQHKLMKYNQLHKTFAHAVLAVYLFVFLSHPYAAYATPNAGASVGQAQSVTSVVVPVTTAEVQLSTTPTKFSTTSVEQEEVVMADGKKVIVIGDSFRAELSTKRVGTSKESIYATLNAGLSAEGGQGSPDAAYTGPTVLTDGKNSSPPGKKLLTSRLRLSPQVGRYCLLIHS